jgi:hypothetical protein
MKLNLKEIGYSKDVMKRFMWLNVGTRAIQFREFVDWQSSTLRPWGGLLRGVNHFTKPSVHQTSQRLWDKQLAPLANALLLVKDFVVFKLSFCFG